MRHIPKFLIVLMLLCSAVFCRSASAQGLTINFTLPASYVTSAGVYNSSGVLIKHLWSKVSYTAGPHTATWNGTKDDGTTAPAGTYTAKILYHNVNYVWEGVIGNTGDVFSQSSGTSGLQTWHGYDVINDIAITGSDVFVANGSAEGNSNAFRATTSAPNSPYRMVFDNNISDAAAAFRHATTDGTRVYFANNDSGYANGSCVVSYNVSDSSPATFSSGVPYQGISWGISFASAIDVTAAGSGNTSVNPPTGLAVQTSGSILAVAHSGANQIRLFNKTTGASAGTISVTSPGKIAFAPSGDLWVVTGTSVARYTLTASTGVWTVATTITGFTSPYAVAVHPSNSNIVLVTDGGTSQQIKAYNSTGTSLWTLGTAGGYNATNGPAVTNTKFQFIRRGGYITFQSDGSFWVGDSGNYRSLHFDSSRNYLNQIAFIPANYVVTADMNNPTRVIGMKWLEYQVDYSKPLLPGDPQVSGGNGSWKLVKNWNTGLSSYYDTGDGIGDGISTLATLSNGRVYGMVNRYDPATSDSKFEIVELPSSGPLRFTGTRVTKQTSMYANGALRYCNLPTGSQEIYNSALTGFDGSGNPTWGTATLLASAPTSTTTPSYRIGFGGTSAPQFPITSSNVVVSFDSSLNNGYHLGGFPVSGSAWSWQSSPSVSTIDFYNTASLVGDYDIGDSINYGGNTVHALDRNVVYGFHGENWQGKQAGQFMHFYDNGLFVGQYGGVSQAYGIDYQAAAAAGNAFNKSLITANGNTYQYNGDESQHAGIHRWRLDNLTSITEMSGSASYGGTITISGVTSAPTGLTATAGNAQVVLNWTATAGATSYNVYRGTTSNGQSTTAIATSVTGTTYTNTGLTNGTTYYYKIKAVNSAGTSAYSNEASATPQVPAPGAPTGLTATSGNAQAVLTWTATSGATSYNVYRGTTSNGQSTTAIATGITATTYTNTGLTNGTTYYYKIKAVNAGGTSGYSNEASTIPASVTASIAYAATAPTIDGTVDTVWNDAVLNPITRVVNGTTTVTGSWKAMWNSSKLFVLATVSDASLLNGTMDYNGDSIELYVDADNSKSTSYGANDFQFVLGWSDSTINEYAHSTTTGVTYAQANITGGYRMEFAIPWTTLGVTPVANNAVGIDVGIDDAASSSARAGQVMWRGTDLNFMNPSLFGIGYLAPTAPTGLTATSGNTQVVLNWTATSGATSYNVYRGTTSNGQSTTAIATGITATTYTNTGLTNGTTYYYKIKAVNAGGTSGYSNEANATPN